MYNFFFFIHRLKNSNLKKIIFEVFSVKVFIHIVSCGKCVLYEHNSVFYERHSILPFKTFTQLFLNLVLCVTLNNLFLLFHTILIFKLYLLFFIPTRLNKNLFMGTLNSFYFCQWNYYTLCLYRICS